MSVNLSIKDVPDDLAARLRVRAVLHHRSLQGELMAIIERAAAEQPVAPGGTDALTRSNSAEFRQGTKTIEQIAAEHRALYPEPLTGLPRSVDIIREMRDSR